MRIAILVAKGEFNQEGEIIIVQPGRGLRPELELKGGSPEGLRDAKDMQEGLDQITFLLKNGRVEEADRIYQKKVNLIIKWIGGARTQ